MKTDLKICGKITWIYCMFACLPVHSDAKSLLLLSQLHTIYL